MPRLRPPDFPEREDGRYEFRNQQEEPTMYINISERYGDKVLATIEDYQELNPEGHFQLWYEYGRNVIREILSDDPGDYEVVAAEQD